MLIVPFIFTIITFVILELIKVQVILFVDVCKKQVAKLGITDNGKTVLFTVIFTITNEMKTMMNKKK